MLRIRGPMTVAVISVTAVVQTVAFDQVRLLGGARIDLPLLLVVGVGFLAQPDEAAGLGFATGLIVDLSQFGPFGMHALVFCLAAWSLCLARIRMFETGFSFRSVQGAGAVMVVTALTWLVGGIFGQSPPVGRQWIQQLILAGLQGALLVHPARRVASWLFDTDAGAGSESVQV
jgi:rod shape-determining protein MreD